MRLPSLFVTVWLVLGSATAMSADLAPNDFAFGSGILLDGEGAIWEVELPAEVYQHVARRDLGDIRVFNAASSIVPHVLRRPPAETEAPPAPASLSVFPLFSTPDGALVGRRMRIVTDESGAIVRAETEAIRSGEVQRLAAYLVDLRELASTPSRLQLHWRPAHDEGFAATVRVEGSSDLTAWKTLVDGATIADLSSGTERLIRRTIDVPESRWVYLRITWPEALEGVVLERVVAEFPPRAIERRRNWMQVPGKATSATPPVYEFDVQGHFPIDRVRVEFSQDNVVARGTLSSRADLASPWRPRDRGVYFRVLSGEELVRSEAVALPPTADRYWRLELEATEGDLGPALPRLAIGWVSQLLTFVAQGPAPYTLAYGSSQAPRSDKPVAELLAALEQDGGPQPKVGNAKLGPEKTLGGEIRLLPPDPPLPWKTWLLWGVLILGVALLAWMVVSLLRQLEQTSAND